MAHSDGEFECEIGHGGMDLWHGREENGDSVGPFCASPRLILAGMLRPFQIKPDLKPPTRL
ncbi:MAG TPA: hypothetical protein DCL95_13240 [Rhodospirillaceae bacterium]|nr:hypothetical protein [Rhodospirillaceae bacterium]MAX64606.1 hypothetical protein [Rhodospirillaceae bacterium]MBB58516.1 hypothetical protein [Rhodospirillaceae bacterium]HAE02139.1 hypothetical protein [Rhodospirillaceae bacterium]HAJ21000.1 hypothetical protein [Rhodospirillaceae bacterium]